MVRGERRPAHPLGIVPLWDARLVGEEIRLNAARGCRAVTFTEMPSHLGLPSIHDPSRFWDPFFAACDETGTALCMHIGSGSKLVEASPYAPLLVDVTLTFTNAQQSMVEWLLSGRSPGSRPSRSPSRRARSAGCRSSFTDRQGLPHVEGVGGAEALDRPPSELVPGRVYGCFFDDDTGIANRDAIGVEQIVFEVDYPHQDTTWPNTTAFVEKIAAQVSREELKKIVRTNAMDLLGFDTELPSR